MSDSEVEIDYLSRGTDLHGEPCYRVIVAILRQAVEDAVRQPTPKQGHDSRTRMLTAKADAVAWIMSDDRSDFSAVWCIELLGLNIETIRSRVRFEARQLSSEMKWARKKCSSQMSRNGKAA